VMRSLGSGVGGVRMLLLSATSALGGIADSVMSPYFCPLARKYGFGSDTCGHILSARFCTQFVFMLLFGRLMRNYGATRIYLLAIVICSVFNTLLFIVSHVNNSNVFLGLSILLLVLSTVGDAGIFCSINVLAGQQELPCIPTKSGGASGPALMETMYAVGTMLGPLLGGIIVHTWGWAVLCLMIGLSMFAVAITTALLEIVAKQGTLEDGGESHEDVEEEEPVTHLSALCRPWVAVSCFTMVASGVSSTWYISSLETHLSLTLQLSPSTVSLIYMCPALVYAFLTPLTGLLLDRGASHVLLLVICSWAPPHSCLCHLLRKAQFVVSSSMASSIPSLP